MRKRNEEKQQLVKETAIKMLVEEGFEGFSMNKLARACDVSVATLYIYYQDKDDLVIKIARDEFSVMCKAILADFDPHMPFAEGLKMQWQSRAKYMMAHPVHNLFFEKLRSSSYYNRIFDNDQDGLKKQMGVFIKNAVARGELSIMPLEVFWSIAYAPLYTLLRFDNEGTSIGGKQFSLTNKMLWQAFDHVLKALKP